MDCCCGDPSCGFCQAARVPRSNNFYSFDEFIPMVPFGGHLKTIYEVDENKEDAENEVDDEDEEEDDDDEDEENNDEDEQDIEVIESINQHILISEGISDSRINALQVSEDEKKRLRNTEAARRCREKIKRKTEDLEEELTTLASHNDLMNQHRIRLLSQVEEQMRMLDMMKKRKPEMASVISFEAKEIVDTYSKQVGAKRKAIQEYYEKTCTKSY